jgi:hypothetical protein
MYDGKVLTKEFGQKIKQIMGGGRKLQRKKFISGKLILIYENIYGNIFSCASAVFV